MIFLSTPSARRATYLLDLLSRMTNEFLSTPSARRATGFRLFYSIRLFISIHALREEGDSFQSSLFFLVLYFYPRPPRGGRPSDTGRKTKDGKFLSTPSARRATNRAEPYARHKNISIHALREEGDRRRQGRRHAVSISIHALREEGDSKNRDKISIFL